MVNATHVTEEVRFESEEEIKDRYTEVNFESGDVMGAGVPIISTGRTAYVDDSEASTFVVGASGSGKTRKILMPYTWLFTIRKVRLTDTCTENLRRKDMRSLCLTTEDLFVEIDITRLNIHLRSIRKEIHQERQRCFRHLVRQCFLIVRARKTGSGISLLLHI